jgi:hypothetical protein
MSKTILMSVNKEVDAKLREIKKEKMLISKSAAIAYIMEELDKCKQEKRR